MHPRSIYFNHPPNFVKLASLYPEFRPFVKHNAKKIAYVDFKNDDAMRALSICLLRHDFNIDVDLPSDRLIPAVPNRLNYILWIQDILDTTLTNLPSIKGLDIGSGASCIYPLLGCASRPTWSFVATDIDVKSLEFMKKNVYGNNLESRIIIHESNSDDELIPKQYIPYTFTMCNPPFFSSIEQAQESAKAKAKDPSGSYAGALIEMVTPGGEYSFISRILKQSLELRTGVMWYSTMVGHLETLRKVVADLRQFNIDNYTLTDFTQGQTRRWAVAWSFNDTRPPYSLSAGFSGTIAHNLRPPQTQYEILHSSQMNIIPILGQIFETADIEYLIEGRMISGRVPYDSWSRASRRLKQHGKDIPHDPNDFMAFRIEVHPKFINIIWTIGHKAQLFESIVNHIRRRLREFEGNV